MTTNKAGEQPTITQADISRQRASWEALYIDFGDYWHVEDEKMVAWAINNVAGLFGIIDRQAEELARHRTTSLAAQDGLDSASEYVLEWIAAPRPPAYPKPMTGRQSFGSFEAAVGFMAKRPSDSQFVKLTKVQTCKSEMTLQADAALLAIKGDKS